jgi:fibronectin type 3 domain-containing protein
VTSPLYTAARGYGFSNTAGTALVNRGAGDALTRDFFLGSNQVFSANLAKGWYVVTVYFGDAKAARSAVQINAEGAYAATVPATSVGQFVVQYFAIQPKDSQWNLRFIGLGSKFALDG